MHVRLAIASFALLTVGFAGCFSDEAGESSTGADGETVTTLGRGLELSWAPGSFSSITNTGNDDASVTLPFGWLQLAGDETAPGAFTLVGDSEVTLAAGSTTWFIPPPRVGPADFVVNGESLTIELAASVDLTDAVISGENAWDLSAHQEEHFPHRKVDMPDSNYYPAIDYFAAYFAELGMEVEADPYDTRSANANAAGCQGGACPGSAANVVATLPGTDPSLPSIFVAGGHFDMVPQTTHAAFDDTSGVVATLELARAMSQFEWKHTLMFGLWGGEEDGIVGSQFWVQTHPDARQTVTTYWNLDVVGMSWPAPLVDPDPIVIAVGPDAPEGSEGGAGGPIADSLTAHAMDLQTNWFGYPDTYNDSQLWYYEGIGSGQVAGYAGVNAQSDHTPFMAAGIPAFFIFNGDTLAADNPIGIHNERDTLENMTRYAFFGGNATQEIMTNEEDFGPYQWDPAEYEQAKAVLAESWEVVMWFPFYSAVLQDVGYWYSPGPAGQSEANSS